MFGDCKDHMNAKSNFIPENVSQSTEIIEPRITLSVPSLISVYKFFLQRANHLQSNSSHACVHYGLYSSYKQIALSPFFEKWLNQAKNQIVKSLTSIKYFRLGLNQPPFTLNMEWPFLECAWLMKKLALRFKSLYGLQKKKPWKLKISTNEPFTPTNLFQTLENHELTI